MPTDFDLNHGAEPLLTVSIKKIVNKSDLYNCNCAIRKQVGIPCAHIMAVLCHCGKLINVELRPYIDEAYSISTLRQNFNLILTGSMNPIITDQ